MMTPEQRTARYKKLVSTSRSILTGETGLSVGAFKINRLFQYLEGEELEKQFPIFGKFTSKIPHDIPVGTPRLNWEANALMERDKILNKIENKHREEVLWACIEIIKKFG